VTEYILGISLAFLSGLLGGGLAGTGLRWGISRRCLKLEVGLLDMQKYLLSLKGQKGAEARWAQRDLDLEQLKQFKQESPSTKRRYDNDPFVSDEMSRGL
jgi:hypothetical protein